MRRKSKKEITLETRLAQYYDMLAREPEVAGLMRDEIIQVRIEQVKYELSRLDRKREARRLSTRDWVNAVITILSIAAAVLIAIFKTGR